MIKRLLILAMALLTALPVSAARALSLPECRTVEQVEAMLLYPGEDAQPVGVEAGRIRYVSQDTLKDPDFCAEYWYGGEPGGELDLTLETAPGGKAYAYYARNMCTRAVYSMALSYLGINLTPGGMSAMTGNRVVKAPYDETTGLLPELEKVSFSADVFRSMFEAYRSDEGYSPVYLHFMRRNGTTHAVLVVAQDEESGRYIVVDPKYREVDKQPVRVYTIALNRYGQLITASDFRSEQVGSRVIGCYQWRLTEEEENP